MTVRLPAASNLLAFYHQQNYYLLIWSILVQRFEENLQEKWIKQIYHKPNTRIKRERPKTSPKWKKWNLLTFRVFSSFLFLNLIQTNLCDIELNSKLYIVYFYSFVGIIYFYFRSAFWLLNILFGNKCPCCLTIMIFVFSLFDSFLLLVSYL